MSDLFTDVPFPRAPLRAAAGLVIVSIVAAALARYGGIGTTTTPMAPVAAERELRFVDRTTGGIDVIDARTGQAFDELKPGADGFIRATLRGLVRERKRRGIGAEVPFHLALHTDGHLTLEDPAIDRTVELEAFGPTNSGAFARLLPRPAPAIATRDHAANDPAAHP